MATKQIQKQTQQQKAKQRLTPQQVLVGQMIEKPIDQLTEFLNQQMHENPALEESGDSSWETEPTPSVAEMAPAVDEHSYNDDDYLPVYTTGKTMEPSDMMSFYDKLKEQMMELELDERQRFIMEYLIGTLDSDGLLRKSLDAISDEMAIYHNFEATTEEIGEVLRCLQTFDPPGVGASDLRECLLLQVERKKDLRMREVLTKIIGNYFDDLLKNHWEKLQHVLHLTDEEKVAARQEIRKLNPRPGSALGEVMGFNIHQITPDFIVETNDDGRVVFTLNRGHMPALEVSQSYIESLDSEISDTDSPEMASDVIRRLDYNKPVVEIADMTVKKGFRNMGLSKIILQHILDSYNTCQFYVRVSPTDGVDEQTLVKSLEKYGFIDVDSSENGTFMVKVEN